VQIAAVIFLLALPLVPASKLGAARHVSKADPVRAKPVKKATDESLIASAFSEYVQENQHGPASPLVLTQTKEDFDPESAEKILEHSAEKAAAAAKNLLEDVGVTWKKGPGGLVGEENGQYVGGKPHIPKDLLAKLNHESSEQEAEQERRAAETAAEGQRQPAAPAPSGPSDTYKGPQRTQRPILDPPDVPAKPPAVGAPGPAPGFALPASPMSAPATPTTTVPAIPLVSSTADDPEPIFQEGWQQNLIDPYFYPAVDQWGSAESESCSLKVTHRNVVGYDPAKVSIAAVDKDVTVDVIEKHVSVEVPKIVEERVPVDMKVTHDRMIYVPTKQVVPRYVEVEKVEKQKREVEVPKIVEVIKNVSVPGPVNQVTKTKEKNVTMEVVTVRVDQVSIPMVMTEQKPVYHNVTKKVERLVTVPKYTKRRKEVNVTRIEENLIPLPSSANASIASAFDGAPANEKIEVEVAKVKIRKVKVPVEVRQDRVVYKTVKQRVERRVEKPEVKIKQKIVEVPEYKEVIREVPVVEVRNRTVELIKEVLEVDDVPEIVNIRQERLIKNPTSSKKSVTVVTETPEFHYTQVPLEETHLSVVSEDSSEVVGATEWTNITQEKIVKTEQIEYIDKYVDVIIEQEEIVEVPKFVTKTVIKEVIVETIREEIVQVPEYIIVNITREEPEEVLEELQVVLTKEEVVAKQTDFKKELRQEHAVPIPTWSEVEVVSLVPKPFAIMETSEEVDLAHDNEIATHGEEQPSGKANMTEEVIVQDFVHKEIVKKVPVPNTIVETRDVHVPVFQIEEQIVEVPKVRYEEEIVEVPRIYEQEKIVEVPGPATEEVFEEEVIVPHYVSKQVVARVEVPKIEVNQTDLPIPVYKIEESIITVEKEIFQDELVEVEQVVKVDRYTFDKVNFNGKTAEKPDWGNNDHITYLEKEVEQVIEVPEPVYVDNEVIVPVYEVEEVIVEVPKITMIEEIVEVPRIVEIEKVVEVPTVEYQDIVIEKIIHKHALQTKQKPNITIVDKVVNENTEVLHLDESVKTVPFNVQVPSWTTTSMSATQKTTTRSVGVIKKETREVEIQKPVIVKKKVERLVPNEIIKIIKKHVEVVREVIVEKVVPVIKETVLKKEVKVPVMAVKEHVVKKQVKHQVVTASEQKVQKEIPISVEFAVNKTIETNVPVHVSLHPRIRTKDVFVPIPCAGSQPPTPVAPAPAGAPAPGAPAPGAPSVDVV